MRSSFFAATVSLICLWALPGCQDEILNPHFAEGQGIRMEVSGGFAGVGFTLFLDGTTGFLVGESCRNLCDFSPGEVLAILTDDQLDHVVGLFQTAGIHDLNGRDFGVQCCDQFYFDLRYEDELGVSTVRGSSEVLPEELREAVSSLLALMQGPRPLLVNFTRAPESWPSDPLFIETPGVEGDELLVRVGYGGGCKVHLIQGVAHGGWMESDPVQVRVLLSHEDFDDPCDAFLTEDLRFDLNSLKWAYQDAYGVGEPGATTLRILLEDPRLASPMGAWTLDYRF